jgi:hypothetical protein
MIINGPGWSTAMPALRSLVSGVRVPLPHYDQMLLRSDGLAVAVVLRDAHHQPLAANGSQCELHCLRCAAHLSLGGSAAEHRAGRTSGAVPADCTLAAPESYLVFGHHRYHMMNDCIQKHAITHCAKMSGSP